MTETTVKKKSKNYIENELIYDQLVKWKTKYDEVKAETGEEIPVSDELTKSIYTIAKRTATRYNFGGYDFNDDMIQDAMYVTLKYIRNYNLEKKNPHAYITTCCWNAFVNRINIEKKHVIKKYKHYVNFVDTNSDTLVNETGNPIDYEIVDQMSQRVSDYESRETNGPAEDSIGFLDKHGNPNLREFFNND